MALQVRYVPLLTGKDGRTTARFYKAMSHVVLPMYRYHNTSISNYHHSKNNHNTSETSTQALIEGTTNYETQESLPNRSLIFLSAQQRYTIWLDPTHAMLTHPIKLLNLALAMPPSPPCPPFAKEYNRAGSATSASSTTSETTASIAVLAAGAAGSDRGNCGWRGGVWGHQHNDRVEYVCCCNCAQIQFRCFTFSFMLL